MQFPIICSLQYSKNINAVEVGFTALRFTAYLHSETQELASNSEDEKRIRKAQTTALRKKSKEPSHNNKMIYFCTFSEILGLINRKTHCHEAIMKVQPHWFNAKCDKRI